jgi:hypothetical protein
MCRDLARAPRSTLPFVARLLGLGQEGAAGGDRDSRSAEQIAADFKTIYTEIEGLVRQSAEQETSRVGFGVR